MTPRTGLILAAVAVVTLTAVQRPAAYAVIPQGSWASGSTVPMYLQLGAPPGALSDGATSWNDVAASAIAIWNRQLTSISFISRVEERGRVSGDGVNDVFFGDSLSGDLLGPDTLAVTARWTRLGYRIEADVVFNSAKSWESYRGAQRPSVVDFRRVALHALGHGLGLTHPDTAGQSVAAVMNSSSHADGGSADDLQADDIAGARALYGGAPTPLVAAPARIARAEIAEFRRVLEARYRDIGVGPRGSFVDGQASAIWVSEYMWYRVSYCDHATATARVFAQAEGRGVQPVCAEPASNTAVPSAEDVMAFRASLEVEFRDVLKTAQSDSNIPANEEALLGSLYLRYRWIEGLTHGQALDRTADIIAPPAPAPPTPAPGPAPAPQPPPTPGADFIDAAITSASCGNPVPDSVCEFRPGDSCPFINWTVTVSGTTSGSPGSRFFVSDGITSLGNISCAAWTKSDGLCIRPASGGTDSSSWTARQVEEGTRGQSRTFSMTVEGGGPGSPTRVLAATRVTCSS